jgi:L-asparaginase/Glu-tRNA(Gln) amidotransferase subunit D
LRRKGDSKPKVKIVKTTPKVKTVKTKKRLDPDAITLADAEAMTPEEWMRLPVPVQERIMKEY